MSRARLPTLSTEGRCREWLDLTQRMGIDETTAAQRVGRHVETIRTHIKRATETGWGI